MRALVRGHADTKKSGAGLNPRRSIEPRRC